ncbi:MAG: hypothetical protein AAF721_29080 [Myxococcota bacterium]
MKTGRRKLGSGLGAAWLLVPALGCTAAAEPAPVTPRIGAPGPDITIGNAHTGDWIDGMDKITGDFSGVDPLLAGVKVNGEWATIDTTDSTWEIDYQTILDDLGTQTPQHPLTAVLFEGAFIGDPDPELKSVHRVTFHDLSDYGVQKSHETEVHADGFILRIEESAFAEFEEMIATELDAVREETIVPRLEAGLNPDGAEIDFDSPVEICASMAGLGLSWDALSIGPVELNISLTDFLGLTNLGAVELCLTGFRIDVTEFDTSQFVLGNTVDTDGDGVAEPFVALDSRPGRIAGAVNTGALAMDVLVTPVLDISVDPLAFLGIPSPVSIDLVNFDAPPCDLTLALDHLGAEIAMDVAPGDEPPSGDECDDDDGAEDTRSGASLISVTQFDDDTTFELGNVSVTGNSGICGALGINSLVPEPVEAFLEGEIETLLNGDELAYGPLAIEGPDIPALLEKALEGAELTQTIPLGDPADENTIELDLHATFQAITEDDDGITIRTGTNVQVATSCEGEPQVGPYQGMVDYQPDSYYVANNPPSFGRTTPDLGLPYDFAPAVAAGTMTQALQAAYNAGFFHSQETALDFQALGICVNDNLGGCLAGLLNLDAANLCLLMPQLCSLPTTTALEIHYGPRLAPVVVVDDIPGNATLKLSFHHFEANVVEVLSTGEEVTHLTFVADFEAQLGLTTDGDGALGFTITSMTSGIGLGDINSDLAIGVGGVFSDFGEGVRATMQNEVFDILYKVPLPTVSQSLVSDTVWDIGLSVEDTWPRHNDETLYMDLQITGTTSCGGYGTQPDCLADVDCFWAPMEGFCVAASTPMCYPLPQPDCDAAAGCEWVAPPGGAGPGMCRFSAP